MSGLGSWIRNTKKGFFASLLVHTLRVFGAVDLLCVFLHYYLTLDLGVSAEALPFQK